MSVRINFIRSGFLLFLVANFKCTSTTDKDARGNDIDATATVPLYMKTDGYYFELDHGKDLARIFLFYKNGIVMHPGSYSLEYPVSIETDLRDSSKVSKLKSIPWAWGKFTTIGDSIIIDKFYPGSGGPERALRCGRILSDTSFVISATMKPDGQDKQNTFELYYFKKLPEKPDSVNDIVKW
jgi:hypothetical protein